MSGIPQNAPFGSARRQRSVTMALFVSFEVVGEPINRIWVNAELITSIRPGDGCTLIYFDKDQCIAVNEPMERVMLQINTGPISS